MIAASPPSLLLKTPLEKREYLMDPFTGRATPTAPDRIQDRDRLAVAHPDD